MIELLMVAALAAGGSAEQDRVCADFAASARTVMKLRQAGARPEEMMARMGEDPGEIARRTVIDAFSKPREPTPERAERAIEDFGADAYVQCMSL